MDAGREIKNRMTQFLKYKNIKAGTLERIAMLGNAYLRNSTGGYSAIKLGEIKGVCPDLNLNWLVTGEGKMLLEAPTAPTSAAANGGDVFNQFMMGEGGTQYGKVDKVEQTTRNDSFFENTNYEAILSININDVPQQYRGIVRQIKKHHHNNSALEQKVARLEAKIREMEQDLTNQTIESLNNTNELNNKLLKARDEQLALYKQLMEKR